MILNYKVDVSALSDPSQANFESLSLDDKKKVLIEIVDKNNLYVNYDDVDSQDFEIDQNDKEFSKSFYGE